MEMKQPLLSLVVFAAIAALFAAQSMGQRDRSQELPALEVHSVFPREVSPGIYQQVAERELQILASQGWELVSVTPYVYRNEEHGQKLQGPRDVVTQTYPAYFFKRPRIQGSRQPQAAVQQ